MMISSNSGTDFISVMRAAGQDPATLFVTEEFRTWLVDYLSENELVVTFTKADGTDRVMRCTRNSASIPTEKQPKSEKEEPSKSDAVRVFDTEKQEWRSFKPATIKFIDWSKDE